MKNSIYLERLNKWVVGAGIFNIVAAFPLSMPFLYKYYYTLFNTVNNLFGFGGRDLVIPSEGGNKLFINTAGLALVLVGMMLIYSSRNLKDRIGIPLLNAIIRIVFSFLLFYYIVSENILVILLAIGIIDIIIAAKFLYYIFQYWKQG